MINDAWHNNKKNIYESRIERFGLVVKETCDFLCNSNEIEQLRNDSTSASFIPGHIAEVLNSHLLMERDNYVHESIITIANLQFQCKSKDEIITKQNRRQEDLIRKIEEDKETIRTFEELASKVALFDKNYQESVIASNIEISEERMRSSELEATIQRLKNELNLKKAEMELLQSTTAVSKTEHSSSSFFASDSGGHYDILNQLSREIKEVKLSRDGLVESLHQHEMALEKLSSLLQLKEKEATAVKAEIRTLITEVECLLADEEEKHNLCIKSMNIKLQTMQEKMASDNDQFRRSLSAKEGESVEVKCINETLSRQLDATRGELESANSQLMKQTRQSQEQQKKLGDFQRVVASKDGIIAERDIYVKTLESNNALLSGQCETLKQTIIEERKNLTMIKDYHLKEQNLNSRLLYQNYLRHSYTAGDKSLEDVIEVMRLKNEKFSRSTNDDNRSASRPSYKQLDEELRAVRLELADYKLRAMREQEEYMRDLNRMRLKFDQLLSAHEDVTQNFKNSVTKSNMEESISKNYFTALSGVLRCLVTLGLIPEVMASNILASVSHEKCANMETIYSVIGDQINQFVVDLNESKREIEVMKSEQKQLLNLNESLDRLKAEYLTNLESERAEASSSAEAIKEKMRNMKSKCKNELIRFENDFKIREQNLKINFENELVMLRRDYETIISNLNDNLCLETKRRKEVENLLAAKEETMQRLFSEHDDRISSISGSPRRKI